MYSCTLKICAKNFLGPLTLGKQVSRHSEDILRCHSAYIMNKIFLWMEVETLLLACFMKISLHLLTGYDLRKYYVANAIWLCDLVHNFL
jgi:hypothetical protein